MPLRGLFVLLLVIVCSVGASLGQSRTQLATGSTLNVGTVIANAWFAFSGSVPVHSIQLTGQATTQAGSSSDSGTITATASADITFSTQLSMTDGTWSETRTSLLGIYQCSWTGPDGVQHEAAAHNCWQTASWLIPSLAVQPTLAPSNIGVVYVGHETIGNEGVEHLQYQVVYGGAQTASDVTSLIQKASTADLYLDSSSFLPVMLRYSIRADNDANRSIPVQVYYSNYALISGVTIPQTIQRSIDGTPQAVVNISSIATN
jgi:hypothetical protein